jgi:protein tyrosine phosphatase (PTP) superfamily phosphohydrolase (DUF442 family)
MAKIAKKQRRWVRDRWRDVRRRFAGALPVTLRSRLAPCVHYADMLFVDHGIFRVVYPNRSPLGQTSWRAAQPTPGQIADYARRGVRTVVNLRGPRFCGSYWLEQEACRRHGLELVDFQVRSRAAPSKAEILATRSLLDRLERPLLLHCKSGADRAGLVSVLYCHHVEGLPIEDAVAQLHWRFGHFRAARTGILDHFFECYLEYARRRPMSFFEWVETVYDPDEVSRTFRAERWTSLFVDRILRRE